jgi:hypothetical protein
MIYNLVASARKPLIKDPADFLYQFSLCQTQFPNLPCAPNARKSPFTWLAGSFWESSTFETSAKACFCWKWAL